MADVETATAFTTFLGKDFFVFTITIGGTINFSQKIMEFVGFAQI